MSNDTVNILGATCNNYELQPPVYIQVRRETLLHNEIGNPTDPLDYNAIASKLIVDANDVAPPFVRVIPTDYTQTVTVYPCEDETEVQAVATLKALRVLCAGNFTAVLYSPTQPKIYAEQQEFIGLDQVPTYISPDEPVPPGDYFDIDIDLENGPVPTDPSLSQYIGFVHLEFHLDNPLGSENGPGTYFFVVHPMAKIKKTSDPS